VNYQIVKVDLGRGQAEKGTRKVKGMAELNQGVISWFVVNTALGCRSFSDCANLIHSTHAASIS